MSKDNKVNPGQYTQRGRLTQDEAARELSKQRHAASPKKAEGSKFGEPDAQKVKDDLSLPSQSPHAPRLPDASDPIKRTVTAYQTSLLGTPLPISIQAIHAPCTHCHLS